VKKDLPGPCFCRNNYTLKAHKDFQWEKQNSFSAEKHNSYSGRKHNSFSGKKHNNLTCFYNLLFTGVYHGQCSGVLQLALMVCHVIADVHPHLQQDALVQLDPLM
jgi:hypothetical protein